MTINPTKKNKLPANTTMTRAMNTLHLCSRVSMGHPSNRIGPLGRSGFMLDRPTTELTDASGQ